jgi:hypothetical protein
MDQPCPSPAVISAALISKHYRRFRGTHHSLGHGPKRNSRVREGSMESSANTFRFTTECPACEAMYLPTGQAIGRTAKCRCGHRFTVTGPHFATILAHRAILCACTHCNARVVASPDAPRAVVLCCHCGKTFEHDHKSARTLSSSPSQRQDVVAANSLPCNATAPAPIDSPQDDVRAAVAAWPQHTGVTADKEEQIKALATPADSPIASSMHKPQECVTSAHRIGLWTGFRCPTCSHHNAFVANGEDFDVCCALCSEHVHLKHAHAAETPDDFGNPTEWMQCFCPRCNLRFSIGESYRDETICCPKCSHAFTAPLGQVATYHSPMSYSPPSKPYAHRPLPVKSYRKRNGTWVAGYRRSQPRKRR